jgi:type II secretory pathway component PulC
LINIEDQNNASYQSKKISKKYNRILEKKYEKRMRGEFDQRVAKIAQEENCEQFQNTPVELPAVPTKISIVQILLISSGGVLVLVWIIIKIRSYWSKNNNTSQ